MNAEELIELGFKKAGGELKEKQSLKRRLLFAYENYKVVTPEIYNRFNAELKKQTMSKVETCYDCGGKGCYECSRSPIKGASEVAYDKLVCIDVSQYPESPPQIVLAKMKKAKDRNVFDTFEVAKIETINERPDPLLFGRIKGCKDRFFIAQWDDDVKIADLLKEGEG
jgi:hypothetical protein